MHTTGMIASTLSFQMSVKVHVNMSPSIYLGVETCGIEDSECVDQFPTSQADAEPDDLLKQTGQETLKALTFIKVSSDTHSE